MLVTFELRMRHVSGPDFDWWQGSDKRVPASRVDEVVANMMENDRYRCIAVQPDPHEGHSDADIARSTSGLASWCTVPGCTWHWDYD